MFGHHISIENCPHALSTETQPMARNRTSNSSTRTLPVYTPNFRKRNRKSETARPRHKPARPWRCGTALLLLATVFFAGCASTGPEGAVRGSDKTPAAARDAEGALALKPHPEKKGSLEIDVTSVVGHPLAARIDLLSMEDFPPLHVAVPNGALETQVPVGVYRAYINVFDAGVPVLVDVQRIKVAQGETAFLLVNLLEGASGTLGLRDFDYDGDLSIDRVELDSGTDPKDPASIPGLPLLPYDERVLGTGQKWYRGELFAHSEYGRGEETVSELVRRAEQAGLDFLAITDLNTMQAAYDPGFKSNSLVLIPAMAWGAPEAGIALIYAPRTLPEPPFNNIPAAQAQCLRVQAQGGIFAIAHPCFPGAPWLWGLSYVNAVQVWCRDWRSAPPITLDEIPTELQERDEDGQLIHSIAAAAAREGIISFSAHEYKAGADLSVGRVSANAQAEYFWDLESVRGLMACAIAGSSSASKKVPLGQPVTHVLAKEKSLPAIIEGLRLGRTFLSAHPDGPLIQFAADVGKDGRLDATIGGVVPLHKDVLFQATVFKGEGKKLQILENGRPILSRLIDGPNFNAQFHYRPELHGIFRARVIERAEPNDGGFGAVNILAMTSPIYAQDITLDVVRERAKELNAGQEELWAPLTD